MKIIAIDDLLAVLTEGRAGTVREAEPDEGPDFVQEDDKLCTGIMGRKQSGETYCFDLSSPVYLVAGRGYVIDLDTPAAAEGAS